MKNGVESYVEFDKLSVKIGIFSKKCKILTINKFKKQKKSKNIFLLQKKFIPLHIFMR